MAGAPCPDDDCCRCASCGASTAASDDAGSRMWLSQETFSGAASSCSDIERWSDPEETLIVFDWDDTLCPTTAGADATERELRTHEVVAERVLRAAAALGRVEIVSMAGEGWMEETTERYMPRIRSVIEELGIAVSLAREGLSARRRREALSEGRDPSHFLKKVAMAKVVRNFYRSSGGQGGAAAAKRKERSWKNVLSIGDSSAERLALQDVVLQHMQRGRSGRWKECRCKCIQLKSEPTLSELSGQLRCIAQALPALVQHDGDLDMEFQDKEDDIHEALYNVELV